MEYLALLWNLSVGCWNTWRRLGCSWRACDAWAWWLCWWRFLECSWRACDAWSVVVVLGGVFWNVAKVRVMRGRGTWDYLALVGM